MGICFECKKTTDLYCIHHKKHICMDCILKNHKNCTICKYRDYVENGADEINTCSVCSQELSNSETLRLPCLCLHHKECLLNAFSSSSDATCPHCHSAIFTEEILKELHEGLKVEIVETFKGKEYAKIITPNEIQKEVIDETAQLLLNNENDVNGDDKDDKNDEEKIEYIQGEMTSLKRKDDVEVPIEVGPTIEFDVTSDDDEIDHGMKKKNQGSTIGVDFVKSLQTKGKISGKTIMLLVFLMVILVILMIIIFATGNKDT